MITLIGATTENPSFEVNDALLSRCQLFVLKPLEGDDIKQLGELALREDQVMQASGIEKVDWEAMQAYTGGDARRFLNLLENLVTTASSMQLKGIDQAFVDHHAPNVSRHYDRAGDQHFDMASALIKSIRGSDPQASLYWTSRMLLGGEKPEFIARRLVIAATEDIGLANTQALIQANACWQAVERSGACLKLAFHYRNVSSTSPAAQKVTRPTEPLTKPWSLLSAMVTYLCPCICAMRAIAS